MKRNLMVIVAVAAGVFGLATFAILRTTAQENLKKELLKISDEPEQALTKDDVAALDRIDADDLVSTNWRGVTLTKAQH